jgi:zinc metalloprotease ZmpB
MHMREKTESQLNAQVYVDDSDKVREITYLQESRTSDKQSPLPAAIEFLREAAGVLGLAESMLATAQEPVSFSEPRQQGEELRLGQQKQMFDSATLIFNQTYLNVPVWRAAITVTLKLNPTRVVSIKDTTERGIDATLPPADKIEKHRTVFALAEADRRLRAKGLGEKLQETGIAAENDEPRSAAFIREILGRESAAESAADDARAIRGRFFIYRYNAKERVAPRHSHAETDTRSETEQPAPSRETADSPPVLELPEIKKVKDGQWRMVSEITFTLKTREYGSLNWRALVDVATDSVLLLEPLIAGLNGMVFHRDPITATGNAANAPDSGNGVLNPLRNSVVLPNLDAPTGGTQRLRGRFAVVSDVNLPNVAPPTRPAGADFNYDVRTNDFAAVNAYYHTDRFFALVESLGFPIATFFDNTTFPVRVDHRDFVGETTDTINAWCVGNGEGGIGYAGYALNDLNDTTNPIGRACDSRVHLHELGGHGILYEHVDSPNFGFAHSAGDTMSAILHDPDSQALDRFRYAPWNPQNTRRFDRSVAAGWAWGGTRDDRGYNSEQILCTTLFRVYRSIGGDSDDVSRKRFASRMTMYLILRAVSTLTPATNPRNAVGFANALMTVDLLNWTSEGVFGGAYNKVIRWAFEKQGLFQLPGASTPVTTEGAPPEVDVYIDDGRGGEYAYQADFSNNPSIWNRRAADGGTTHEEPTAGATNYAYVRVKNRGTRRAQNVHVRGFHHRPAGATEWPVDFVPLTTTELSVGTLEPFRSQEKIVGPFFWVPNADATGGDSLLMAVSADGDVSNIDNFSTAESIAEWRLVPGDNNLGLRAVIPASTEATPSRAVADGMSLGGVLDTLKLGDRKIVGTKIKSVIVQLDFE